MRKETGLTPTLTQLLGNSTSMEAAFLKTWRLGLTTLGGMKKDGNMVLIIRMAALGKHSLMEPTLNGNALMAALGLNFTGATPL